ncbi:hypothetical protein MNJPNG_14920 [Cupriavidus oxalaticus]|uniref:hypothetical protein n=1 Tax=Cupriavidus oxalaticus TaxID=96344 RepID=UPI003F73F2AF
MSLSDLIRKYGGRLATLTGATAATVEPIATDQPSQLSQVSLSQRGASEHEATPCPPTVATIATVAVAKPDSQFAVDSQTGAPYTPYCVPMPAERATAMLVEIREAVGELADAESWSDSDRVRLLEIVRRRPAANLVDDLAHFRQQLDALHARQLAVAAVR